MLIALLLLTVPMLLVLSVLVAICSFHNGTQEKQTTTSLSTLKDSGKLKVKALQAGDPAQVPQNGTSKAMLKVVLSPKKLNLSPRVVSPKGRPPGYASPALKVFSEPKTFKVALSPKKTANHHLGDQQRSPATLKMQLKRSPTSPPKLNQAKTSGVNVTVSSLSKDSQAAALERKKRITEMAIAANNGGEGMLLVDEAQYKRMMARLPQTQPENSKSVLAAFKSCNSDSTTFKCMPTEKFKVKTPEEEVAKRKVAKHATPKGQPINPPKRKSKD